MRPGSSVVLVGQNPGADEEAGRRYLGHEQYESCNPAPFIGKTGRMLEQTFLPLAGLSREDVSLANTLRCRWGGRNELPPLGKREVQQAIEHCWKAHWKPPSSPQAGLCYVAMGEYAFYALSGLLHGFSGWRGYLVPKRHPWEPPRPMTEVWTPTPQEDRVFVTHHLAYLFREPTASLPAKRDWNKLALILRREWPVQMSEIRSDIPDPWPSYASFDTEFAEDHHDRLIRFSLATRERTVWVVEASRAQPVSVLDGTSVVMHNAPADLPHLRGLIDLGGITIEDTMYAHACLWTGKTETDEAGQSKSQTGGAMSHTLNFLGSMYAWINRWKHLARVAPRLYAGGDALGTMDVWDTGLNGGLRGELERDPETKWVYEHLQKPLIPIILKHHQQGIAVDPGQVKDALTAIGKRQEGYTQQAQAYCGWPLNLRSPKQVAYYLFDVEGFKVKRTRRA